MVASRRKARPFGLRTKLGLPENGRPSLNVLLAHAHDIRSYRPREIWTISESSGRRGDFAHRRGRSGQYESELTTSPPFRLPRAQ
jgi:hypothetical protein